MFLSLIMDPLIHHPNFLTFRLVSIAHLSLNSHDG